MDELAGAEWPGQDRIAALQSCEFVNAESSITVAREVGLAAADQERVRRPVRWIKFEGTDGQRVRGIHQSCPG